MNYRQWKKNYKKRYGHNPPSKRQQRRAAEQTLKEIQQAQELFKPENLEAFSEACRKVVPALFEALADFTQHLGEALGTASERYREVAQQCRKERGENSA